MYRDETLDLTMDLGTIRFQRITRSDNARVSHQELLRGQPTHQVRNRLRSHADFKIGIQ